MELKIVFEPGVPISVTGPIDDLMLCYSLLEMAKDVIREYNTAKAKQLIQPARGVIR